MGRRHAETYLRLPGVQLTAVSTRDPQKHLLVEKEWGATAVADYRDLVGKVDAVTVATPTYLHAEVAEFLASAGIHVLVEKPIAATEQEAARLIAAADRGKAVLMVGHIERFNPAFIRLSAAMRSAILQPEPTYIKAYRMGPFDGRIHDVCVVLDLMIHDIDLSFALRPATTFDIHQALGMSIVTSRTDVAMADYTLSGDGLPPAQVSLLASRVNETKRRMIEVRSGGFVGKADLFEQRVWVSSNGHEPTEVPVERQHPLDLQLAHFAASVRSGTVPAVTGEMGSASLKLAQEIVRHVSTRG